MPDARVAPTLDDTSQQRAKPGRWRLPALLLLVVVLFFVGRATGVAEMTAEELRAAVRSAGALGVLLFTAVFCAGNLMQIPGNVFVIAGLLAYGSLVGIPVVYVGSIAAAVVSYWTARIVGGDQQWNPRNRWMKSLLGQVRERPVRSIVLMRLFVQDAPPLNMGMALAGVSFRSYLIGSALGLLPPILFFAGGIELLGFGLG